MCDLLTDPYVESLRAQRKVEPQYPTKNQIIEAKLWVSPLREATIALVVEPVWERAEMRLEI